MVGYPRAVFPNPGLESHVARLQRERLVLKAPLAVGLLCPTGMGAHSRYQKILDALVIN